SRRPRVPPATMSCTRCSLPAGPPEKVCCATLTRVPPWLSRMSTDSTPPAAGPQDERDRGARPDELRHRLELGAHRGHALPPREISDRPQDEQDGQAEQDRPQADVGARHAAMLAVARVQAQALRVESRAWPPAETGEGSSASPPPRASRPAPCSTSPPSLRSRPIARPPSPWCCSRAPSRCWPP